MEVAAVVGTNIRRHRGRLALSAKELAARVGCAQPTLSLIESGDTPPSLAMLCRIARELGVTAAELLEGADTYFRVAERGDIWDD